MGSLFYKLHFKKQIFYLVFQTFVIVGFHKVRKEIVYFIMRAKTYNHLFGIKSLQLGNWKTSIVFYCWSCRIIDECFDFTMVSFKTLSLQLQLVNGIVANFSNNSKSLMFFFLCTCTATATNQGYLKEENFHYSWFLEFFFCFQLWRVYIKLLRITQIH